MDRTQFWVRGGTAIVAMAWAVALAASAIAGRYPLWLRSAPSPARSSSAPSPGHSGPASGSPSPSKTVGPALPKLSLEQMAGQRVIYTYGGLRPPAGLLRLISHGDAAGVIFFSQDVSSRAQLTKVVAELEQADASP